jgi:hypothetical protein
VEQQQKQLLHPYTPNKSDRYTHKGGDGAHIIQHSHVRISQYPLDQPSKINFSEIAHLLTLFPPKIEQLEEPK